MGLAMIESQLKLTLVGRSKHTGQMDCSLVPRVGSKHKIIGLVVCPWQLDVDKLYPVRMRKG